MYSAEVLSISRVVQPTARRMWAHFCHRALVTAHPFLSPQPPTYFLSPRIGLFRARHVSGITQRAFPVSLLSFRVMLSRVFPFVTCIHTSFLFMVEWCCIVRITVFCFLFIFCWTLAVSTFSGIMSDAFWTLLHRFPCRCMFSVLSGVSLGAELLGHIVTLCLTFWVTATPFFTAAARFPFSTATHENNSNFFKSRRCLFWFAFLTVVIPADAVWYLTVVLIHFRND